MNEAKYQRDLIKRLRERFKGCVILKNDPSFVQGIPDIVILYNDKWAMLELKRAKNSDRRPNQEYYVEMLDGMSFAAFIDPGNEEEVLDDLQQTFRDSREARIPFT